LVEWQFFHFVDARFFHAKNIDQHQDEKGDENKLGHYGVDGDTIYLFSVLFDELEHG
jgi:hypothetical protein